MFISCRFKKEVLLTAIFAFLMLVTLGQEQKTNSMAAALSKFINSAIVIDHLTPRSYQKDSLIVFVDLNNVMDEFRVDYWDGFRIKVLKEGPLVDSLKRMDAHYLLKGRCNYYILISRQENKTKETFITLRHACTNTVSNASIIKKNRSIYIHQIENGVW